MSTHSPPSDLFFNNNNNNNNNNNTNNNDNSSNNNIGDSIKTSVLIIVLILSLTTILSLTLCLFLRLLNRRCLRLLSSSAVTTTATTAPSNRHSSHRVSPETFQHSVVDSLPLFTFASIKRRSSSTTSGDCAICLNNFDADDQLRLLPLCCHAFHAHCIDAWLHSNLTCPLCRSPIHASDSDIIKALSSASATANAADVTRQGSLGSFRLEIGSVSRRRQADHEPWSSYSIGSFEYVVEEESEITVSDTHRRTVSDKEMSGSVTEEEAAAHEPSLAEEVASGGRSWLKDYIERLSSSVSTRAMSFRGSGRFFTGSSRRIEAVTSEYDLEANRVGEEISEFFRWFSGV